MYNPIPEKKRMKEFLVGVILLHLIWFLLSFLLQMKTLPSPVTVYRDFLDVRSLDLLQHVGLSLYRVIMGILSAVIVGVLVGLTMAQSQSWNKYLGVMVYLTYPIPKTVFLPVLMILFGLGNVSKILLIFLIVVFQISLTVRDAVLNIDKENYDILKSMNAGKMEIHTYVTLPAIVPEILTSVRLSTGTALSVLFFSEAYGTKYGMGYYILDAWSRIDYLSMYKGIVTISFIGFLLFLIIDRVEGRLCKWKANQ